MLPGGEGNTGFRFVESQPAPGYVPFRHMGWNAAEIMVQDTDAVAAKLAGSPFPVIGPPADLSFSDKIRAMQVLGPSNEALYLTSFKEKMAEFDVPDAVHFVDRVFIVILGGPSVAAINEFYTRHFGVAKAAVMPVRDLGGLAGARPAARLRHDLAALALTRPVLHRGRHHARRRPCRRSAAHGELPPAISMVSFGVERLPDTLGWIAPPTALPQAPYHGRRAAVASGAAGELIELIER